MFPHFYSVTRLSGALTRWCRNALPGLLSGFVTVLTIPGASLAIEKPVDVNMLKDGKFVDDLSRWKGIDATKTHIVYLVLDHETLEWSAYHSKPSRSTPPCNVTEVDANNFRGPDGNPRVFRSGGEKLVIVIENANPFLYSYEGTVFPPQESPDAAAMRTAFSAIANAGAAVLAGAARTPPSTELQRNALTKLQTNLSDDPNFPQNAIKGLLEMRERVQNYVKMLEFRGPNMPAPPTPKDARDAVDKAFLALGEIEILAQDMQPLRCYQVWLPLLRLRHLSSINDKDLEAARDEMIRTRASSDSQCQGVETNAFAALAKLHKQKDDQRPIFLNSDSEAKYALLTLDVDTVLSAKKDFLAAAAQIRAFARISETQWCGAKEVAFIVPPFPDQNWLQDNPGTISIKPEPSVYPECPRIKPTGVEKKFFLASRRQAFLGFGLGVIAATEITDPTYGAVHKDGKTVIGQTSEESRSGAITAMVFLRARALGRTRRPCWLEPGLELGATLDTAKPGIYLGGSLEISRLVRIGAGWTLQKVNSLAEGLKVGDPVIDASDVLTTKDVKSSWYVGITFALDSLPVLLSSK